MKLQSCFLIALVATFQFAQAQSDAVGAKKRFKADISYLASEELQGRLAGSPGDKLSAEYIKTEFEKAGLKPWNGISFQTFDIVQLRIATNKCRFELHVDREGGENKMEKFQMFTDFFPLSESVNSDSVYAEMVHCGYGIEADSLGINDYKYLKDLKGKIFVIQLGYPGDENNVHSPIAPYGEISQKIKTALSYGASGIIFNPGSSKAEVPKGDLQRNTIPTKIPIIYFNQSLPPHTPYKAKIVIQIGAPTAKAYNVLGYKNNRKKNTVIICAHHDHLGHNEFQNSLYNGPSAVHNGADDNASGVAAMLELARTLKGRKYKKNNYLFVAFSGEELGLLGSKYFMQHLPVDKNRINYVINMDMVGRMDSVKKALMIHGVGTSPTWTKSLSKLDYDSTEVHLVTSESGLGPSDHATFYLEGIPVLHFFTGQHYDYHKPDDDENKINYDGLYSSYALICKTIAATNKSGKLAFTKTKDGQPGGRRTFKVSMGIMPDYTFEGAGVKIDGATEGKPAAKAGLQKGDVITKLGDWNISNMQDYMKALGAFEKGDKTKVEIQRGDIIQIFDIEFQ